MHGPWKKELCDFRVLSGAWGHSQNRTLKEAKEYFLVDIVQGKEAKTGFQVSPSICEKPKKDLLVRPQAENITRKANKL